MRIAVVSESIYLKGESLMAITTMLVLVLCMLFVWFTAEYLVGIYLYHASLDVYGLLSFEFQTIDTVKKKIKQSDSHYMTRLLRSLPLKITKFKRGWSDEGCFDVIVYSIILFLNQTKKVEIMLFPFSDDEESLHHPLMRELSNDDLHRYREKERNLQETVEKFSSAIHCASDGNKELLKELDDWRKQAEETLHVSILCVKKLPSTGKPRKQKNRVVVAIPSEGLTRV